MWVRDGGISTGRGSARVLKRSGRVRLFTIPTVASFQGKTVRASIACFYAATPKAAAFAVAPTTGRASLLPIRHRRHLGSHVPCARIIYFGYFPDISVWPAAMFEGSNVQWRLGKIAFHIADKLRRQLTRQG